MWEGPLTVSHGSASCTADVSLVTAVYAATGRSFVIVLSTSGSNADRELHRAGDVLHPEWPPIKRAASSVKVAGNRLSFMPVARAGEAMRRLSALRPACTPFGDDSPPAYLPIRVLQADREGSGCRVHGRSKGDGSAFLLAPWSCTDRKETAKRKQKARPPRQKLPQQTGDLQGCYENLPVTATAVESATAATPMEAAATAAVEATAAEAAAWHGRQQIRRPTSASDVRPPKPPPTRPAPD